MVVFLEFCLKAFFEASSYWSVQIRADAIGQHKIKIVASCSENSLHEPERLGQQFVHRFTFQDLTGHKQHFFQVPGRKVLELSRHVTRDDCDVRSSLLP